MHRRARHLTGRAAGADLYFDARRISASDGDAIQTWSDLSINANDATQATSTQRPLYKVNISGGSPMLLWDHSNDFLRCGSGLTLGSGYSIVMVEKFISTSGDEKMFIYSNGNTYSPNFNWIGMQYYANDFYLGNYDNPNSGNVVFAANTNPNVLSGVVNDSGTNRGFLNGEQKSTASSVSINISSSATPPTIGASYNGSGTVDGYIGLMALWNSVLSASLRKRYEQSCSFAWKIACS